MRGNSPAAWIRDAVCSTAKEAEEGRLNVLVGADPATLAEVTRSASSLLGNNPSSCPVGAGHKAKLIHNFIAQGNAIVLAEAFCTAAKLADAVHRMFVLATNLGHRDKHIPRR
jgi:3-hydroxyisobutyrate dehydrogenase-like beta-hydroxyacid dehydrogenase